MDCSLLGSSVRGIFQARILERLPLPSPWSLPCPGTEPRSAVSLALAGALLPLHHLGSPKSCYFLGILHFADTHALGSIYSNPISMIEIHLINSTGYLPPPSYLVMSSWSPQMARIGIFTPQKCVNYCGFFFFWSQFKKVLVKNLPAMWKTWVQSLSWEDPLEKGMATCSGIRAWRIPWTEEPGKQQSMGS